MTAATDDAPPATSYHPDPGSDALIDAGDAYFAKSVTINRPRDELYAFWSDLTRLPEFMENVVSITDVGGDRTHWTVKAPAGRTVEWDARITEREEGRLLAWETEDGADVASSGRVEFRDAGDRGTIVTATFAYDPPAGVVGRIVAKLFQREPHIQARRDLRRFKQLMETGEVATSSWTRAQHEEEIA